MLRRIKRLFGFTSRGSYFPNSEVSAADGSVVSSASRKSVKSDKKSKKEKRISSLAIESSGENKILASVQQDLESEQNESTQSVRITSSCEPTVSVAIGINSEVVLGGEDSIVGSEISGGRATAVTDSLPYREPSDKSQRFASSISTNAAASLDAEFSDGASTRSIAGSEVTSSATIDGNKDQMSDQTSFVESEYSTDMTQEDFNGGEVAEYGPEVGVDGVLPITLPNMIHSDASSLCVNMPETPISLNGEKVVEEHDLTPEAVEVKEKRESEMSEADIELERRWKEMNDQLSDILKKPAPFQVSTARLPPMIKSLDEMPVDDSIVFSPEEFDEKNNSVARILNESHEATTKSPETTHLRSYGY